MPIHADLDPKYCIITVRVSPVSVCAGNDVQLVREPDREQPLPPGRRPRGLCGAHHRARARALRQSAPRTPGHPRCRQQSWIPGLVYFIKSRFMCSTLSAVACALTERSSDPGTSSLPSTVSGFRFLQS
jgi:hypothetical protein